MGFFAVHYIMKSQQAVKIHCMIWNIINSRLKITPQKKLEKVFKKLLNSTKSKLKQKYQLWRDTPIKQENLKKASAFVQRKNERERERVGSRAIGKAPRASLCWF